MIFLIVVNCGRWMRVTSAHYFISWYVYLFENYPQYLDFLFRVVNIHRNDSYYPRDAMRVRLSVCLSVCVRLSHAGIASKRLNLG